ncbi:AraC family transcriptional regulator [Enterococcus sp.]|uniref:helix-turn-helix transcriptional regulator n=1 Tax=Enterococcus sp. TaxID=35783 RepID=UPI0029078D3C|nr:AraC family transcriptional regulator [Enterococcus sp.]MDU5333021.1 AraC family transcriptional regulator [Enterococcus sp.]
MNNSRLVASITHYIEEHLQEKITLEELALQLHYSKYYLLHEFKETTHQSLYNYIKRRRLNEAARALLYSDQRIIEVAVQTGYQSQQAFTKAFEELFKLTPRRYRLQNKQFFIEEPFVVADYLVWAEQRDLHIRQGRLEDQLAILYFVQLMRGALPYLEKEEYLRSLRLFISEGNCYLAWAKGRIVGLLLFDQKRKRIENLTALPSCWNLEIEKNLLTTLVREKAPRFLSTTTFRVADKLDIGHRQRLLNVGFVPNEQIMEVNYPTERLVLSLKE